MLNSIDIKFTTDSEKGEEMLVQLTDIVLGRFRKNAKLANMLVGIIHEIHRRMTIPAKESQKAKRPEDVRKSSWMWPHVMWVMRDCGIISDRTNKAQFGMLIEKILGDKVKPNSIRRSNYGDFSIVELFKYNLKDFDKDICEEILELFMH